jgi:hypothetical protein
MEDQQLTLWRTSTYTANGGDTCVEVARFPGAIAVRDSKDREGPRLRLSPAAWRTFTDRVRTDRV